MLSDRIFREIGELLGDDTDDEDEEEEVEEERRDAVVATVGQ